VRLVFLSAFDSLVSDDLCASVAEWDPSSVVWVFGSHEATAAALRAVPDVFAVLVKGAREAIEAAGLPALASERGGRLLWISDRPEAEPRADDALWIRVEAVFSPDHVRAALDAAARRDGRDG
jgi:hypothetical protein